MNNACIPRKLVYNNGTMETKPVIVRDVPVDLWKRLKLRAIEDDHTLQVAVVRAIQAYLERAA